jgi:hypothetical protein
MFAGYIHASGYGIKLRGNMLQHEADKIIEITTELINNLGRLKGNDIKSFGVFIDNIQSMVTPFPACKDCNYGMMLGDGKFIYCCMHKNTWESDFYCKDFEVRK